MKKRLYLLEWKLRETRAWLGWMVFWIIISFMFLSAMLRSFVKQSCPPARLAVYLVFTLAGLLVEGTRDRDR